MCHWGSAQVLVGMCCTQQRMEILLVLGIFVHVLVSYLTTCAERTLDTFCLCQPSWDRHVEPQPQTSRPSAEWKCYEGSLIWTVWCLLQQSCAPRQQCSSQQGGQCVQLLLALGTASCPADLSRNCLCHSGVNAGERMGTVPSSRCWLCCGTLHLDWGKF